MTDFMPWDSFKISNYHKIIIIIIISRSRTSTGQLLVREWWQSWQPNESQWNTITCQLIFQPIAVENLGAFSSSSSDFISALGHKSAVCLEKKENFILVQASVCGIATIQCSFSARNLRVPKRSWPIAIAALFLLLLILGNCTPKGVKIIL